MKYIKQRKYLSSSQDYWYNILYSFLKNYIPGLAHEEGSEYLNFNNEFKLRIVSNQDGSGCRVYLVYSDDSEKDLFGSKYMFENSWFDFTFLQSNGITLFSFQRSYGNTITILWVKDTNDNLYVGGYYVEDLTQNINITRATIYKIINTSSSGGYTFAIPINFMANPDEFCYSTKTPILSGSSYVADILGICSCSMVGLKSTVSFPTGDNYFAISSNHIVNTKETIVGGSDT